MKKIILSVLLVLLILGVKAQYVDDGQDPASIKWRQIDTKYFKLIYPSNTDSLAQKYANVFYSLFSRKYSTLNHTPKKLPIILHPEGGRSNGSVMWAPKRMNLYAASLNQDDFVPFHEHLAIHEYRHVVQVDKMNQGLTKFGSYIFGEHAPIGVLGVYVPMWFMEGDAVSFETGNTKGGRGRLPSFEQEIRAQLVEKGIYSYDKAVLSTYNTFTPNRYVLGYYMIANARKHYGAKIWDNTINSMALRPWNIYSFERGINMGMKNKRDSVMRSLSTEIKHFDSRFINIDSLMRENKSSDPKLTLYYDNMTELEAKWKYEDSKFVGSKYTVKTKKNKIYASYKYPKVVGRDSIIAYKDDLNDLSSVVLIYQGEEKVLFYPNGRIDNLNYRDKLVVWSEYIPHLRWKNGGRAVLSSYDINSGTIKHYKNEDNIFDPCLLSKNKIIAVAENNQGRTKVVKFENNDFSSIITARDGEAFQMPAFVDENNIVIVVTDSKGKHLELINIDNKSRKTISNSEYADIANPMFHNGKIYYSSSYTGKDVICSLDIITGEKRRVTKARFGNKYPSFKGDSLVYSNYTADGYQVVAAEPINNDYGSESKYELADVLRKQERPELLINKDTSIIFESKKYSRLSHLFKVHSWAPAFVNGFDRTIEGFADLGVSIASQNDLSTMFLVAGIKRDNRYSNGAAFAQLQYKGLWPIFDIKLDVGSIDVHIEEERSLHYKETNQFINGKFFLDAYRVQTNLYGQMILPFNLSRNEYSTYLKPFLKYDFYNISDLLDMSVSFKGDDGNNYTLTYKDVSMDYSAFSYNILFYNLRKLSLRDINSKWGQIFEAGYIHSPFGDKDFGVSKYASLKMYFPGLFKNNSLSLYMGYQHYSQYSYSRNIEVPTGISLGALYKEIGTTKLSYTFPIMYPDYSLSGFVYTKRIYGRLFYDTVRWGTNIAPEYYSTGIDLRANVHVLRFKTPLNVGVRYGYESYTKSPFVKLLLNVSFDI